MRLAKGLRPCLTLTLPRARPTTARMKLLTWVLLLAGIAVGCTRGARTERHTVGGALTPVTAQILPSGGPAETPAVGHPSHPSGSAGSLAQGHGVNVFEAAVLPMDAATVQHVRAVFEAGAHAGNHADVFAKLGDSITESASFMGDIGHGWFDLGTYTRLEPVVRYFSRHAFSNDHEDNSFTRGSQSATAGWTTDDLLDGGEHFTLEQELEAIHPAFAFLMIGTNDAARGAVAHYDHNLMAVLDRIEARHTVTLLSTIPDEPTNLETAHAVEAINVMIAHAASNRHIPLIDFNAALRDLPDHGLSADHIHPSIYVQAGDTKAGVFTTRALAFGYNVRNLTGLIALERMVQLLALH